MPTRQVNELTKKLDDLKDELRDLNLLLSAYQVDMVWMKRILVAAASLGFIEKAIGWFVK